YDNTSHDERTKHRPPRERRPLEGCVQYSRSDTIRETPQHAPWCPCGVDLMDARGPQMRPRVLPVLSEHDSQTSWSGDAVCIAYRHAKGSLLRRVWFRDPDTADWGSSTVEGEGLCQGEALGEW